MKVSDYIISRLEEEGIRHAFLVQGGAMNDILFSIADSEKMSYVACGHESGAGFAAEGYAKAKDDLTPGLAIATSGPGAQNMLTAVANCFFDSVPAIFITGQVHSKFQRSTQAIRQVGFQECDIVAMAASITKHAEMIHDPAHVPYAIDLALWCCREGRPGPVLLDIPMDIQKADIDPWQCIRFGAPIERYSDWSGPITQFLDDLSSAERPVILVGGGVRGARAVETLNCLADILRVPLFPTWNALDTVASDHPWYGGRIGTYGGPGRNFAVQNCDLLLAIGCRLSGRITGGMPETFARGARRYVVDIDSGLLDPKTQQQPFDVNIHGDATAFMRDLEYAARERVVQGIPLRTKDHRDWWQLVKTWRDGYDPVMSRPKGDPYRFIRDLSAAIPANAIIVTDCGGNVVMMNQAFKTKTGQRYFSSNGNSPMGFAIAGAIGAWHADKTRPVYCIIGDGGFAMSVHELATLTQTNANVTVFVLNNHGYGITRAYQETHNGGRAEASTPASGVFIPDVGDIARAYGLSFMRLTGNGVVGVDGRGPYIFDVDIGDFHNYEPRIAGWDTPIEDATPLLSRAEFKAQMIGVEPLPGWESRK